VEGEAPIMPASLSVTVTLRRFYFRVFGSKHYPTSNRRPGSLSPGFDSEWSLGMNERTNPR
jgi:hypothetical protein